MALKNTIERGELYLVDFSGSVGSEQAKRRPAVVLQNNIGNKYSPTTIVCPLSTCDKKMNLPTHVKVATRDAIGLKFDSTVLVEQIKSVDVEKRFKEKIGRVTNDDVMRNIDNALIISLSL